MLVGRSSGRLTLGRLVGRLVFGVSGANGRQIVAAGSAHVPPNHAALGGAKDTALRQLSQECAAVPGPGPGAAAAHDRCTAAGALPGGRCDRAAGRRRGGVLRDRGGTCLLLCLVSVWVSNRLWAGGGDEMVADLYVSGGPCPLLPLCSWIGLCGGEHSQAGRTLAGGA